MRSAILILITLFFILGCARIKVEAPADPIKVDISMRLDVYQHVQKDIDAIESIVSGDKKEIKSPDDKQGFLGYFNSYAFAQEEEGLNPEVEQAALRRRNRSNEIISLQGKGIIGENKDGLIEVRNTADGSFSRHLIKTENDDRMFIYNSLARKNNTSVEEIQKLYAARLQKDAPSGTPIEVFNQSSGAFEWKIK
ncbi:MAG: DUF1318 domain-containing protein [Candidatus Omnitrophica bacterium]|nr:DUF1318 domain-containing protein [Candidatus Omnitrophota bacterium]